MIEIELGLENTGFEEGWREVDGIGELKVANGWHPWWHHTDRRPEFKIATPDVDAHRVRTGTAAQQWFTSYSTHTGGLYQQIHDVPVGKPLVFTAYVQAFTRNDDGNFRVSDGRYRVRIGIDPYGGVDAESSDVVWSEAIQPYDEWFPLRVDAVSRSDRCTVFLWGQPEWPVKHNNAYVDDTRLVYMDEDGGPPGPEPTGDVEAVARAVQAFARTMSEAADQLARDMDELIQ